MHRVSLDLGGYYCGRKASLVPHQLWVKRDSSLYEIEAFSFLSRRLLYKIKPRDIRWQPNMLEVMGLRLYLDMLETKVDSILLRWAQRPTHPSYLSSWLQQILSLILLLENYFYRNNHKIYLITNKVSIKLIPSFFSIKLTKKTYNSIWSNCSKW